MKFLFRNIFMLIFFLIFLAVLYKPFIQFLPAENKAVYEISWQKYGFIWAFFFILLVFSRFVVNSFKKATWKKKYEDETGVKVDETEKPKPAKALDIIDPKTVEKEEPEEVPSGKLKDKPKKDKSKSKKKK
ncbi:MAG: hypothetical protein OEZ22_08450 [Spirochaetia bacterium]|nr:hypothetical protein [Spirochaetia bacterium]